ncbi:ATP-grasp domain-containing protein [Heyndrickxia acidicola]|uniref:ATP-grasp domain-containing protein n=1 Tax=Heyndrickxia acidicola TaxID=209389 RepID=A0ABU6MM25_9BACI|nr:ATP-grasp domain-containing protein [Heyndrickxia acidicola]MED1205735.1 ATP-grasp domain-containing protein [Heyndrickxia acidicola]
MKTFIFIGTNKSGSSREAIRAADRLGFFTVLFTNRKQFLNQRAEFPDVHLMLFSDLDDVDSLKNRISILSSEGKKINGIMSFMDSYVQIAAQLSEEFGLGTYSLKAISAMENKLETRTILQYHPSTPFYIKYNSDQPLDDFVESVTPSFPLVVKSPFSTGSKDVLFVNNKEEFKKTLSKLSAKEEDILIEEYLQGPQYLIEVLVHNGYVSIVAIIEQQITYFQHFIVTGYALLAEVQESFYNSIFATVSSILHQLGLKNGACHFEMRWVNGEWKLIEINPRISGGAMNRMIEVAYGINLVEETIRVYLGNKPNLTKKQNKFVYTHYLTVNETGTLVKVTGRNRCSKYPGVEEVFIKPRKGKVLHSPKSMGDRYGYVMAASNSQEEAKKIAIEAAKEITFNLNPNINR